jgi:hypothetical protein
MTRRIIIAALLLAATPGAAHRLDEYLQGTILSVGKHRVEAQMTLTPGVAVLPAVLAAIGADQQVYAERVLHDLTITADGYVLRPRLVSVSFPAADALREGFGEIVIDFVADLPSGGQARTLTIENRHLSRISAYQVNCLVPDDPDIRITAQKRNYTQSSYRLEYVRADSRPDVLTGAMWIGPFALLLIARVILGRRRGKSPAVA